MKIMPGSPKHQALLRAIVDFYEDDPRVVLVGLFGSVARGDWHPDSDLDLDIVVADGVEVDPVAELWRLDAALAAVVGDRVALVIPTGPDDADVVLVSLARMSVRYHTVGTTSPNIVQSLIVISNKGDIGPILSAGRANSALRTAAPPAAQSIDTCVYYALEAAVAVGRGQLWLAQASLGRIRGLLMALYAQAHGASRPIQYFDGQAPAVLQSHLAGLVAAHTQDALVVSVLCAMDVLEQHLKEFGSGAEALTAAQRQIVAGVRARLEQLAQ